MRAFINYPLRFLTYLKRLIPIFLFSSKLFFSNRKTRLFEVKNSLVKDSEIEGVSNDTKVNFLKLRKIQTLPITLPVISSTVLRYAPGDLGDDYSEETFLYYSPESISSKEFLESVLASPFNTETHDKNTDENSLSVDGWANKAWFDESDKTVYAKGFVIGEDNVNYTKDNKDKPTFGTSAYISFPLLERVEGKTPEGLYYNAIARKALCNHIAILPNIRDEKNKIVAINAKNAIIKNGKVSNFTGDIKTMTDEDIEKVANAVLAKMNSKNSDSEQIEKVANAVLAKMNSKNSEEELIEKVANAVLAKMNSKNTDTEKDPAVNSDTDPVKEAANAVLPSEKLIAVFADNYGVRFSKTPTVKELAALAEITYTDLPGALNALKKKAVEIQNSLKDESAKNSDSTSGSLEDALRRF